VELNSLLYSDISGILKRKVGLTLSLEIIDLDFGLKEEDMKTRNTRISTINAKVSSFDEICEKAGFGDLKPDNRAGEKPIKRMAIWHYMHGMGIRLTDIAKQSNRSHATVWSGIRKFKDYLSYGDKVSLALRDKINEVVSENG